MTTIERKVPPKPHDLGMIFLQDLCAQLSISPVTLRSWVRTGRFPKPIEFNRQTKGWRRETIEEWLKAKAAHA
jgi:predicted DNA-binding transcriptional regulator AlpA